MCPTSYKAGVPAKEDDMASRWNNLALSESGFLFDPSSGQSYSLNETGALLLRALIGGAAEEDLVDALVAHFETDRERAERDVEHFLRRLDELGLRGASAPGEAS